MHTHTAAHPSIGARPAARAWSGGWRAAQIAVFAAFTILLVSPIDTPRPFSAPLTLAWAVVCLLATAGMWLPDLIAGRWVATPVTWWMTAYAGIIAATSPMSASPWHTLLAALLVAGLVGVFFGTANLARRSPAAVTAAVLIVICGVALLEMMAFGYHVGVGLLSRPKAYPVPEGWSGYPELGALGVIQFGLILGGVVAASRRPQIALAAALAALSATQLTLLYSRIDVVAIGVVVALALLLTVLRRHLRRVGLIAGAAAILGLAVASASPTVRYLARAMVNPRVSRPAAVPAFDLANPSTRLAVWSKTLSMIGDSPWYGSGLGNFRRVFESEYPEVNNQLRQGMHAHNLWLQQTAELGVIGGAIYAALWATILWRSWRLARVRPTFVTVGLFLALAGTTITNLADTVPEEVGGLRIYTLTWVLFGLVEGHTAGSAIAGMTSDESGRR